MKQTFTVILFFVIGNSFTQAQSDSLKYSERLVLDFSIIDYPYVSHAAGMAYNKRLMLPSSGTVSPTFGDYLKSYESPSMAQALALTKGLHATNYYFQNKLWNRWIDPRTNRKSRIYNRVAANAASGLVDYAIAYHLMVFGPVWLHEEFHRSVLALQHISNIDETYYRLNGRGIPSGSVSHVLDEDMANFKRNDPQELVRSFAAGIEGQYQLLREMQKDDFFYDTDYPNVLMHILLTKEAIDYVNQFKHPDYDASIDTMNYYGEAIPERDFVGWDFTPWVYDLFRPDEPYAERGTHPHGNGVNRVIKRSQLTAEEDAYLRRMGRLQYLNFLSPFMIGIKEIRIGDDLSFNFAMRHYPTSFGYNLNADFFFNARGTAWMIALHSYHNRRHRYPGIEVMKPAYPIGRNVTLDARAMLWLQPERSAFYADNAKGGGLLGARIRYPVNSFLKMYVEAEGKTAGWVAGNPFLKANLTTRFGVSFDMGSRVD